MTGLSLAGTILARRYKILNELGDAGNSILYDALQGSPLFETSALYQLFQERA